VLLNAFWEGLKEEIQPIDEAEVIPLMGMDRQLLTTETELQHATSWLTDVASIIEMFEEQKSLRSDLARLKHERNRLKTFANKVTENMGKSETNFNDCNFTESNVAGVNKGKQIIKVSISENEQNLLLQAINQYREEHQPEGKASRQLAVLEADAKAGQVEPGIMEKLGLYSTPVANVVGIASAIGQWLGG
jgi:hypothetical protein